MNLILLEPGELAADGTAVVADDRARHIREVLRAAPGDTLRIGLVEGPLGHANVLALTPAVRLECHLTGAPPPRPPVDLLLAMPRPKVMKRLWPVLAALGVGRILITRAWKTERNYFDTHVLAADFIRAQLLVGLQQAGDTRLPAVGIHRQFKKAVAAAVDGRPYAARLVAHPGPAAFPHAALAALPAASRILLAIGPEGGWVPTEREWLAAHGFATVSWGPRPLRTDTACAVLLGLLHAALAASHPAAAVPLDSPQA